MLPLLYVLSAHELLSPTSVTLTNMSSVSNFCLGAAKSGPRAMQAEMYRAAEAAARAVEAFGPGALIAVNGSAMDRLFIVREGSCCQIEVRALDAAALCGQNSSRPCKRRAGASRTMWSYAFLLCSEHKLQLAMPQMMYCGLCPVTCSDPH